MLTSYSPPPEQTNKVLSTLIPKLGNILCFVLQRSNYQPYSRGSELDAIGRWVRSPTNLRIDLMPFASCCGCSTSETHNFFTAVCIIQWNVTMTRGLTVNKNDQNNFDWQQQPWTCSPVPYSPYVQLNTSSCLHQKWHTSRTQACLF